MGLLDELDETEMIRILAMRTCWSRNHELSFRYFRTLARKSAGKGHLLRTDDDEGNAPNNTPNNIPNMEGGRATLLALFLLYCPSVLAELNLGEEQRVGEITGLEVLAESNSYFKDENISIENVVSQGFQGGEIGCTITALSRGIQRSLPERMKLKHEFQDQQIEFGLMKCFESKHFFDGIFKEQRLSIIEIREKLHHQGLPIPYIARAFSLARSVLRVAMNNTIYTADPVRDKELEEMIMHGCCRDAGGEGITTTLMLALYLCPPDQEDARSMLLVARAVTHLPLKHMVDLDEQSKIKSLIRCMLLTRNEARDMSTRSSVDISVAMYRFFVKTIVQRFCDVRSKYLKESHQESGSKWRKRDITKCRRDAFKRELEVTNVILNARSKIKEKNSSTSANEFLGGLKTLKNNNSIKNINPHSSNKKKNSTVTSSSATTTSKKKDNNSTTHLKSKGTTKQKKSQEDIPSNYQKKTGSNSHSKLNKSQSDNISRNDTTNTTHPKRQGNDNKDDDDDDKDDVIDLPQFKQQNKTSNSNSPKLKTRRKSIFNLNVNLPKEANHNIDTDKNEKEEGGGGGVRNKGEDKVEDKVVDKVQQTERIKGSDLCTDIISNEVTPLEISRLRKKWSDTLAPSPLGRGAPRVPFVDPQPGAASNLSRNGPLASPRGRKFTLRGAASAMAVAISAQEIAALLKKERQALGHEDEGFNVQGFMQNRDESEGTRRAVLRSASNLQTAITEEALAAASADAPVSKYSMTHNVGNLLGNQTGRTQGTGSGLLSSVDPANLVPYEIAASAIRLDHCSLTFKKRLAVIEEIAKNIEIKQKAASMAVEAARIARRRSISINPQSVPETTTATNINSTTTPIPTTPTNNTAAATTTTTNNGSNIRRRDSFSANGGGQSQTTLISSMFQNMSVDDINQEPISPIPNTPITPTGIGGRGSFSKQDKDTSSSSSGGIGTVHQQMTPQKRLQFMANNTRRNSTLLSSMFTQAMSKNNINNEINKQSNGSIPPSSSQPVVKTVKTGSRFDLDHFVDSYGAYAVSVKMRGGGPGYRSKKVIGSATIDQDHVVAAASLIQRSFRLRAHRRYLWACAYFRVPLHVAFLFHRVSITLTDQPTDFFNDINRHNKHKNKHLSNPVKLEEVSLSSPSNVPKLNFKKKKQTTKKFHE